MNFRLFVSRTAVASILTACLAACAYTPAVRYSTDFDPIAEIEFRMGEVDDGRGRFREIYCRVLQVHGPDLPDYMPCEEALTRVGEEPPGPNRPVYLGENRGNYLIGFVPGFGWECIQGWLDHDNSGPLHVARFGYGSMLLEVDGLSGTTTNAARINESLQAANPAQPMILIGYSKGAVDLLEFIVSYPETARNVVAVVAVGGAVGGSPLALEGTQSQASLLTRVPRSNCDEGDGGGVEALWPDVRRQWLDGHQLPDHIRYYSVVTYPDPETRISSGLKPSYRKLAKIADARNDSQLVFYDQVIPGSTLLGFTNADHWAMAVPVARQHEFVAATFVNRNNYPREAMFEAIIRYIEEDLLE